MTGAIACFGEAVLRLGPSVGETLFGPTRLDAHLGGAEVNVAAALAALGHCSRLISALPEGPVGDGAIRALRGFGIDTEACLRRPGRLGLYYLIPGTPVTGAQVIYDRDDTAFARTLAKEWDWSGLLAGCQWLHISGVTPALGSGSAEAALAAARAANAAGLKVSFDGNWRGRLWERWDGEPRTVLSAIIAQCDVLFGNHKDAELLLERAFGGEGKVRRREAALALLARFPRLSLIASTARTVLDPQRHTITARLDVRDESFESESVTIAPIIDRIGTGDAFAAGVIDGLLREATFEDALKTGLALTAIKHGLAGDNAAISREMLSSADFVQADVSR